MTIRVFSIFTIKIGLRELSNMKEMKEKISRAQTIIMMVKIGKQMTRTMTMVMVVIRKVILMLTLAGSKILTIMFTIKSLQKMQIYGKM